MSSRSQLRLDGAADQARALAQNRHRLLSSSFDPGSSSFSLRQRGIAATAPGAAGCRASRAFLRQPLLPPGAPAPDRCCRRPAGCARPPRRGRAAVRPRCSVTAMSVKSVVPPPISTTRMRSPTCDALAPVRVPLDPGVEGGLRLFEQRHVPVAGLLGGASASTRAPPRRTMPAPSPAPAARRTARPACCVVPGVAQVLQIAARSLHRRNLRHAFGRVQGQQRRGAVDAGVATARTSPTRPAGPAFSTPRFCASAPTA